MQPEGYGPLVSVVLHHFADASDSGYGCVTYVRLIDNTGRIHCAFVFAKCRVVPLKKMTVPRLELAAAGLAVKVDTKLRNELDLRPSDSWFWSDSMCVLCYIKNVKTRFHVFVANRVAAIREVSSPGQWRYVPTHINPADDASRGLTGEALVRCERWRTGPQFLWEDESEWPSQPEVLQADEGDPEVKPVTMFSAAVTRQKNGILDRILSYFSDWYRLKRFVGIIRRAVLGMKHSSGSHNGCDPRCVPLSSTDMKQAEHIILKWVQDEAYVSEIKLLQSGRTDLPKGNKLTPLNPVMLDGILSVGGRISHAPISDSRKHPAIIPPESPIATLIVRDAHVGRGHCGREQVLAKIRERFWIVHGSSVTRQMLKSCVYCRRRFARPASQQMADLPPDRVASGLPPFTNTGVDFFGPLLVKQGRSTIKRYGVLFTCLVTRAVHLEVAVSLETSDFINVLRRFIARRGQVKVMRSDNGTNFVGAVKELKEATQRWNNHQIEAFLLQKDIDWIFNSPSASHQGGSWERLIRSVRRVLLGINTEQPVTHDGLCTLLAEAEAILNGRPLTKTSTDPDDLTCITPNHLLLLREQQCLPPGAFTKDDNYTRRRWRQIQYLADLFWQRWTREYLPLLQARQKWFHPKRNLEKGDIVLLVESNAPRGSWPMGKITSVFPDRKGQVRNVEVTTSTSKLIRPVQKLVLLLECE